MRTDGDSSHNTSIASPAAAESLLAHANIHRQSDVRVKGENHHKATWISVREMNQARVLSNNGLKSMARHI
jgi:hypothetical protein